MKDTHPQIIDRIDSFLSHRDAKTLRGDRRMGTELLLDMLAERISLDDSANIIRIKEENKENSMDHIHLQIVAGKDNYILLYADIDAANILAVFPDVKIFKAKEICHQVPVCFKEPILDSMGGLNCSMNDADLTR
jgi:hypothetical protein